MNEKNYIPVLNMSASEARNFFLEGKSYSNVSLPTYFDFEPLLKAISQACINKNIQTLCKSKEVRNYDDINYQFYANKDGNLSWRLFQLIHPLMYVHLVHTITEENNWEKIKKRFKSFQKYDEINCASIPIQSNTQKSNQAEQILHWWEDLEQKSISLSLQYSYMIKTDIADCYPSIYTHSIAWAIEGKENAKKNQNNKQLLGNKVDEIIMSFQYGQTNGIPQGSVLMDFIAEILLGYIDRILYLSIRKQKIQNFKILRYRDDYRIFTKSHQDASKILKTLSDILISFGLKINSSKTGISENIITESIKADKLAWMKVENTISYQNVYRKMLIIREHALNFPNSGSVSKALSKINKSIPTDKNKVIKQYLEQLISITTDIAIRNPRTIGVCISVISKILANSDNHKDRLIELIVEKLSGQSHTELVEIWLQRLLIHHSGLKDLSYKSKLATMVFNFKFNNGYQQIIWNDTFISWRMYSTLLKKYPIINQQEFDRVKNIIESNEVDIFSY